MNKLLIGLSLSCLLTACGTTPPPAADPNALPDGIMQPVEGTGAVGGGSFMPEIEKQAMPTPMKSTPMKSIK